MGGYGGSTGGFEDFFAFALVSQPIREGFMVHVKYWKAKLVLFCTFTQGLSPRGLESRVLEQLISYVGVNIRSRITEPHHAIHARGLRVMLTLDY